MKKSSPVSAPFASIFGRQATMRASLACLLVIAGLAATSSVSAAPGAWTSTASGAWGTNTNWSPVGAPTGSTTITFTDDTPIQHTLSLGGAAFANTITFANGTGNAAFVFDTSGSTNLLAISGAGGITNNATQTQIFNNQIALISNNQTWSAASGGLTFDGVTLSANLTLSGANNQTFGNNASALVNSGANRTLTNNSSGTVNIGAIALSESNTSRTFTVNGSGNTTVTDVISQGGTAASGLTYSGTGRLTLAGANIYTGATSINSGVLAITSNGALGAAANTSNITVASGGALQMSNNIVTTNAGTLILNGTGAGSGALQSVSGDNLWNSNVRLASNASIFSSTAGQLLTIGNASAANLFTMGANTVTFDGAGNTWVNSNAGVAGDTGGLIKNGTGKLTLYGYNTFYTGATVVNAGSLDLIVGPFDPGIYGINGSLTIGMGPANPAAAGTVSVNIMVNSYANQISPTSAVTINSDGVLNVGAATGLGALTLNGGQVNLNAGIAITPTSIASATNTAHQTSQISGGQINLAGATSITAARDATITTDLAISSIIATGGNALAVGGAGNITFSGALTGTAAGSLTKSGAGTLVLAAANPAFLGSIAVNAGILQTNIAGAITAANAVTVAAGAGLNTNGFNQVVGAFTNNGILNLGAGSSLTLTGISALNGTLAGSGTIILNTGSILTLGANFNNTAINFQLNGGTLKLNGTNDIFGSLIVSGDSIIDFSGGAIADFSSVSFPGSSILTVNNWTNAVSYFYSNATIGTQGSAPANQIVFAGNSGNATRWITYTNGPGNFHQVSPVPEPGTYGLIFIGLSLLGTFFVRGLRQKSETAGAAVR